MYNPAGKRNKKVTLQSLTIATDENGETTETAATIATVWASIEPLNSREQYYANQVQSTTTHKITILYHPSVTTRTQAVWNGRTFNFDSVINLDEANRELLIMATEQIST
jgi:SPP1 family predicted phage head-tail adaptor